MSIIRGRFEKAADKSVTEYTVSTPFDWRLYQYDIAGSIAHAKMLSKQNIITEEEGRIILKGLEAIREEIEKGKFVFNPELEDIHMNIEAKLIENIGNIGGKLHTARSRNDQVVLDLRLFIKEAVVKTNLKLREMQRSLVTLAESNKNIVIPGYTHLQPAQPILLAHHLLAYFEMLQRDIERFDDCLQRTDVMPLGSGAVAGVNYDIDRDFLAHELGFSRISKNSIDAVSDRDFVIDYQSAACITMMHLSRLNEEMVLWSSYEFDYIDLDEAYTTGSSIMPQKKNPDVAELARGKTGRIYGNLMALLTMMKGLPLSYNRDMQEDKESLFDTVDTLLATLTVLTGMTKSLRIKRENINTAVNQGYLLATDLVDYLVKKGESFRTAHEKVGKLVSYATKKKKRFTELSLGEYRAFTPLFDEDVKSISIISSLSAKNVIGGTAPEQVDRALKMARRVIGAWGKRRAERS